MSKRGRPHALALGILLGVALVVVAWGVLRFALPGFTGVAELPPPRQLPPPARAARADFVGTERCEKCHAEQFAAWSRSTHGRAGGSPSRDVVIAAFNNKTIHFRNAVVTPRASGNAYEFVVRQNGEDATRIRVDGVIGGGHMEGGGTQGFVTRRADGTWRFLPFDWSRQGQFWFCNTATRAAKGWVPITPALRLEDCGDWPPARVLGDLPRYSNCQGCHASQLTVELDTAAHRYDTRFTSLSINCESCHGPARRHLELAERGTLGGSADIGFAPLGALGKDASLGVCYQCHAMKDQLRSGYLAGDSLSEYYSLKLPLLGDAALHPDGRVRTFAYQEAHQFSDCYLNGGMTCTSCHDPHSQRYRDVKGAPLIGRFDDRQCTSCHAAKEDRVEAHSHHAPASAGSRCTACHMPYLREPETGTGAVRYSRSDHSIAIPRPLADSALGVVGACAGCHPAKGTRELERQVRAWWGEIKPVMRVVAGQMAWTPRMPLSAAAPLLLGESADTAGDRHAFARFAGVSRLLETYARPDEVLADPAARGRMEALARHPDDDVRAAALATLHLTQGSEAGTRRLLARALREAGAHDASLRARWSLVLGYMGDRYAAAGDATAALIAYRRALEVTPANARVLLSLANAERDAGDPRAAIATYRRSLAIDARQPIALVNLGIALGVAGDTAAAIDALTRASSLDPGEPLAPFNLANIHLARGELDLALGQYGRAATLDPGIAVTHFRLARVWLLKKDYPAALRALRSGLMFDSSDVPAREAAAELSKLLQSRRR